MARLMTKEDIIEEFQMSKSSINNYIKEHPESFEFVKKDRSRKLYRRSKIEKFFKNKAKQADKTKRIRVTRKASPYKIHTGDVVTFNNPPFTAYKNLLLEIRSMINTLHEYEAKLQEWVNK